MRILHISSAITFGGGERHVADLGRELTARGHEVFAGLRPTNQWQHRLDFIPADRFLHVSIRNSFGMFSAKRIAQFAEQNRIDIIHAHVARDYVAASVAARSAKTRLVLTRHVTFPMKSFHRFALRNVDAAIAVSPVVRDQLEKIFPHSKVRLILNGIALASLEETERSRLGREFREFHSIPPDAPLVATLGELKVLKGQRDLVLAANEVVKRDPSVRFVVAGQDHTIDQKFRRELRRLVRVLGMEENFIWLDWLEDISPLMAAADLFVSPSHSESFGLAIVDAMAVGVPVVATGTAGARELIHDRHALVPVKDPIALASRISWYLAHDDERAKLGRDLEAAARSRFGLDKMVDGTEAVYREVITR